LPAGKHPDGSSANGTSIVRWEELDLTRVSWQSQ
jgi:hypothetical protein